MVILGAKNKKKQRSNTALAIALSLGCAFAYPGGDVCFASEVNGETTGDGYAFRLWSAHNTDTFINGNLSKGDVQSYKYVGVKLYNTYGDAITKAYTFTYGAVSYTHLTLPTIA